MGEEVKGEDGIERSVQKILDKADPRQRLALSRRLRSEIWDMLSEDDRARIRQTGLDFPAQRRGLKDVK